MEKGGKFKLSFLFGFTQKGGKIAENIFGKGVLFNSQNDDGVPIFHGNAGTGHHTSGSEGIKPWQGGANSHT